MSDEVVIDVQEHVDQHLSTSIAGEPHELRTLRAEIAAWLGELGIDGDARDRLIIAAHEIAAQAIERGAAEVVVQGDIGRDAVRLSIAGGDWSTVDDLRSHVIRSVMSDVRVHRGVVGLRLERRGPR